MGGELNVGPSVSCKGDSTGLTIFLKNSEGELAHLISLRRLVLVSFNFLVPVVVICKVPGCHWVIVQDFNFYGIARVTTPVGRSLARDQSSQHQDAKNLDLHNDVKSI